MTLKTHTIEKKNPQHNQEWSWEETPEFVDALLRLETSTELRKNLIDYRDENQILPSIKTALSHDVPLACRLLSR